MAAVVTPFTKSAALCHTGRAANFCKSLYVPCACVCLGWGALCAEENVLEGQSNVNICWIIEG